MHIARDLLRFAERPEKQVDRRVPLMLRDGRGHHQHAVDHRQLLCGRNDVDVVLLDVDGLVHLLHGHLRCVLQQLVQVRLVLGRQVEDDDERDAALRRHLLEELQQPLESAGRRADPHDGEIKRGRGTGKRVAFDRMAHPERLRSDAIKAVCARSRCRTNRAQRVGCACVQRAARRLRACGDHVDGVGDQRVDAPADQIGGARRIVDGPGGDAQAGVVDLVDPFLREQRVLQVERDAAERNDALAPVVGPVFAEPRAGKLGRRLAGGVERRFGKRRQQRSLRAARPQRRGVERDRGAGFALAAARGLDLDVDVDAVRAAPAPPRPRALRAARRHTPANASVPASSQRQLAPRQRVGAAACDSSCGRACRRAAGTRRRRPTA